MNFKRRKGMPQEIETLPTLSSIRVNSHVTIDLEGGFISCKEVATPLTKKEHQVLCLLVQRRQISHRAYYPIEELVRQMYPKNSEVVDKPGAIQETIHRLRKKFAPLPGCDHIIESRPGWGYRLHINNNTDSDNPSKI